MFILLEQSINLKTVAPLKILENTGQKTTNTPFGCLHWVEYQYHSILVLSLNGNISVWMFKYSEHRLDI